MSWLESDIYWVGDVSSWFICALLTILILFFHLFKIYQDLFTKQRKSISHRPTKPDINKTYVIITFFSLLSIVMYAASLALGGIGNLYFMHPLCTIVSILVSCSWQLAKCGLYIVLLLRLYTVYKGSQYRYNPKILSFIGIFTIIINLTFLILLCTYTYSDHYKTYDNISIAIVCSTNIPELLLYSSAAYDVIMSCACLFAFITPLKKLIQNIPDANSISTSHSELSLTETPTLTVSANTKQRKNERKMVSKHTARLATVGLKFLIVTMTAVLSSLFMLIFVGITDSFFILSYDMLINTICILLMTPYYPDKIYYDRLCFCCIQCCTHCKYNGMDHKLQIVNRRIECSTTSQPTSLDNADTEQKLNIRSKSPSSIDSNKVFDFNEKTNDIADLKQINSVSMVEQ